ncbi:lysine-rich arabinogalactan protein 19-like [Solanum stenotomum]|uniref:lysine-rich arabinogalactan protein 19-like n=1 Tax=Solanum stenotomum TaxID=172797 RepID=UPI0020D01C78|nr:lysine-rich arabinogalactan protein 19-like [Solanum stenotomum]
MTFSIHGCSAVFHHPSATTTASVAVFSGENCNVMKSNTVSLKRKSISPISSPSEPSPKRVSLNSPPPSAAIAAAKDGTDPISPITSPSPKRVTLNSPPPSSTTAIAAAEDGPVPISPKTSPSPAFSPFSKRVSEKSPFATTNAATADATATPPPLPFSRFTKTQPSNNNKTLRRTLSEPPIFGSFTDFCRYMNSQSPENSKNNPISVKSTLRRSISDPTAAKIILAPAPATATPALTSGTGHEKTTRSKVK